MILPLVS